MPAEEGAGVADVVVQGEKGVLGAVGAVMEVVAATATAVVRIW